MLDLAKLPERFFCESGDGGYVFRFIVKLHYKTLRAPFSFLRKLLKKMYFLIYFKIFFKICTFFVSVNLNESGKIPVEDRL